MPRETGGEGESKIKQANDAYNYALHRYNGVDLRDLAYPASKLKVVEKAFRDCIALLEGDNSLLLQDFFSGRFRNEQVKAEKKTQLATLVHDLENAVFEAGEVVKSTPQFGAFLERLKAVEEIVAALRLLLE